MRRKLLLAALCVVGALGFKANAQEDVTSQYITNPGFESCTAATANQVTGSNIDYADKGWTSTSSGVNSCAAVVAYNGVQVNGKTAPATDNAGNPGNALGISVGWSQVVTYKTANVTLPAGYYILSANVYNNNNEGAIFASRLGFVTTGGTSYLSTSPSYPYGSWVKDEVAFYLSEATEGYFQIGGQAQNSTSTTNAKAFFDNLTLTYSEKQMDYTGSVSTTGWLKGDGTSSGTTTGNGVALRENYGTATTGTKLYENVSGLKNGIYTVTLYATSHNARGEGGATLNGTSDDVAYVFATSSEGTKKTYITASGVTPGFLFTEPIQAVISDVEVKDGTLQLGLGLDKANITGWHTIQIKSLTRTAGLDLSGYISAYQSALANAKTKAATTEKISATVLASLNTTITTYDEGKVDEEDADALEEATEALNGAIAAANTSIASYAIIASGTVSTSSLDGWTCTNTNTFHINDWSKEGESDGSGMTTPFIENWRNKSENAGLGEGTFSYTLAGLEPGEVYYAQALIRSYNERSSDAPNGPNFFINDVETNLTSAGTTFTYNGMSGIYATIGAAATVGADGKITLGAKIASNANYNWVAFKNVSIQSMDDAFNAAVAKVTALEGTIPTPAYNAAYEVVDNYSGDNYPTTAADFETAIAAIEAAATTASACVNPYAKATALVAAATALKEVANDNADANTALGEAISTNDPENCETVAALENVIAGLNEAMVTYITDANPAEGAQFDLTFMLTNPDLDGIADWGAPSAQGWATDVPTTGLGDSNNFAMRTTGAPAGSSVAKFVERYTSNACTTANTYSIYQTVNLPVGNYSFTALAYANNEDKVVMAAGDATGDAVSTSSLSTTCNVDFSVTTAGDTKMGIMLEDGNASNWQCIASPKLYKNPAPATEVTMTVKANMYGTFIAPFDVEIPTSTGVEAYTVTDVEGAYVKMTEVGTTIPANTPVLLKNTTENKYEKPFSGKKIGTADSYTEGLLTGLYTAATIPVSGGNTTNYVLQTQNDKQAFYIVQNAFTATPYRCYLTVENTANTKARAFYFGKDGDATAIEGLEVLTSDSYDAIYNAAGVQIPALQKGLNIVKKGDKTYKIFVK